MKSKVTSLSWQEKEYLNFEAGSWWEFSLQATTYFVTYATRLAPPSPPSFPLLQAEEDIFQQFIFL